MIEALMGSLEFLLVVALLVLAILVFRRNRFRIEKTLDIDRPSSHIQVPNEQPPTEPSLSPKDLLELSEINSTSGSGPTAEGIPGVSGPKIKRIPKWNDKDFFTPLVWSIAYLFVYSLLALIFGDYPEKYKVYTLRAGYNPYTLGIGENLLGASILGILFLAFLFLVFLIIRDRSFLFGSLLAIVLFALTGFLGLVMSFRYGLSGP